MATLVKAASAQGKKARGASANGARSGRSSVLIRCRLRLRRWRRRRQRSATVPRTDRARRKPHRGAISLRLARRRWFPAGVISCACTAVPASSAAMIAVPNKVFMGKPPVTFETRIPPKRPTRSNSPVKARGDANRLKGGHGGKNRHTLSLSSSRASHPPNAEKSQATAARGRPVSNNPWGGPRAGA